MNLSPEQQKAVDSQSPAILMMAGPGSGKTHTLVARTKALLERDAHPSQMAVITFTNEAANELKKRSELDFHYCGTLHGFMLRILQEHGSKIGLKSPLTVITEEMRDELLTELKKENGFTRGTKKEINEALALGPWVLGEMLKNGESLSKAQTVALSYYQRIISESMLDYDSILHFGRATVEKLDFYDLKVLYLFVDEYQDSGTLDALIYHQLPVTDRFYIGDPDQSIYAFRGGDVRNIMELAELPEVEVLALEDNYRCDNAIATAAQALIEHNENRPQKVTKSVSALEGKVLLRPQFSYEQEELIWLATKINGLPEPSEVAVLVRTNKLVEYFRDGLRGHGVQIPIVRHAQLPIDYKRTLLYLSLLCNPNNDRLAYAWLLETKGKREADLAKSEALGAYCTINNSTLHLGTEPDPKDVISLLCRVGTSQDMLARIEDTAANLPDQYSLVELVAALQIEPPKERTVGVTVSTIHSAKGREWDYVFLPAFEQDVIPSKSKNATLEEERRLAFVAMTRARHSLAISSSLIREDPYTHREVQMQPSQFIDEISKELICL